MRHVHLILLLCISMLPLPALADGPLPSPEPSVPEIVSAANFTPARQGAVRAFIRMFCFTDESSAMTYTTSGLVRVPEVQGMWTERITMSGCAERKLYLNPTYVRTGKNVRIDFLANGESLCGYAMQARLGPLVLAEAAKVAGECKARTIGYVGLTTPPLKKSGEWREAWMSSGCGAVISVPVKLTPVRGGAVSVEVLPGHRVALTSM